MNPLEINELQKAMMLRGVDYETSELIIHDFRWRCENLLKEKAFEVNIEDLPTLWKVYACEKDENMTKDAQEFAEKLREAIAEINRVEIEAVKGVEIAPFKTNADRIRSMSDEEWAEWISNHMVNVCVIVCGGVCNAINSLEKSADQICKEKILNWLKQPCEED